MSPWMVASAGICSGLTSAHRLARRCVFMVPTEKCMFPVDMFAKGRNQLEMFISMFLHFEKWIVRKNNFLKFKQHI